MINEEWKPVVGYEGLYEVSNIGNVRSLGREVSYTRTQNGKELHVTRYEKPRLLTVSNATCGYLDVRLTKEPKNCKSPLVHDLVAEAFIPNPYNLPEVNHKDGNKKNNCVENLEWCTRSENMRHSVRTGLHKLNTPIRCLEDGKVFVSHNEAARYYGINQTIVSKHVLDNMEKTGFKNQCPRIHLTFAEVGGKYDTYSSNHKEVK